jgi:hypothetical protein
MTARKLDEVTARRLARLDCADILSRDPVASVLGGGYRHNKPIKSGSYPSVPPLHPIFSFKTSGFEGGDGSWLELTIDANDAVMEPPRVAVTFHSDIELQAVVDGLGGLLRGLRDALAVRSATPSRPPAFPLP